MLVDLLQLSLETTLLLIARRNEFRENASVTERSLRLSVLLTAWPGMRGAGSVVPSPRPELPDLNVPEGAAFFSLVLVHCLTHGLVGTALGCRHRIVGCRRNWPVRLAPQLP